MKIKLAAFRLLALVAMGVRTAMVLDYVLPSPAFCGFKAGCEEVTHSAYGRLLGIPLPLWGLAAFGAFYCLTLFPTGRVGKLIGPAAILAGAGGLSFILLQVLVIRRVCPLCMVIDASALFITATELIAAPATVAAQGWHALRLCEGRGCPVAEPTPCPSKTLGVPPCALSQRGRVLWGAAALVALGAAPLWTAIKPARPVPEVVQSLWTPDKITVVEVMDFDCPYCRETHAALDELLSERKDRVRRVRFVLPLRAHKNARPAARAYLAALQQGKGDEMAAALWAAKERSPPTCERLAAKLGLNMESYNACVADPTTDREIDRRVEWLDEKTYPGLPVIWIENQELLGDQTFAALRAAWRRAERHKTSDRGASNGNSSSG
jgi:uncharacterized membrane protein